MGRGIYVFNPRTQLCGDVAPLIHYISSRLMVSIANPLLSIQAIGCLGDFVFLAPPPPADIWRGRYDSFFTYYSTFGNHAERIEILYSPEGYFLGVKWPTPTRKNGTQPAARLPSEKGARWSVLLNQRLPGGFIENAWNPKLTGRLSFAQSAVFVALCAHSYAPSL